MTGRSRALVWCSLRGWPFASQTPQRNPRAHSFFRWQISILEVMRIRKMEDESLVALVKDAIATRKVREVLRRREAELALSRKATNAQGEPDPGEGVATFLIQVPDKRQSTMKRRIPIEMHIKFLFDAVDVFMADKCGLDLTYGFELHMTSMPAKVLKAHLVEDELLSDIGFTQMRVTMEVVPCAPPEDKAN